MHYNVTTTHGHVQIQASRRARDDAGNVHFYDGNGSVGEVDGDHFVAVREVGE